MFSCVMFSCFCLVCWCPWWGHVPTLGVSWVWPLPGDLPAQEELVALGATPLHLPRADRLPPPLLPHLVLPARRNLSSLRTLFLCFSPESFLLSSPRDGTAWKY